MYDQPVFAYGLGAWQDKAMRESVCQWVRSLGLAPEDLDDRAVVVRSLSGDGYELHVERLLRNESGYHFLDPLYVDEGRRWSERIVVPVAEGSWPHESVADGAKVAV